MGHEPDPVSPRTRRLQRAILPLGLLLLGMWVVWIGWWIATGAAMGPHVVSAVLGLMTSLILIATGRQHRKQLPPG